MHWTIGVVIVVLVFLIGAQNFGVVAPAHTLLDKPDTQCVYLINDKFFEEHVDNDLLVADNIDTFDVVFSGLRGKYGDNVIISINEEKQEDRPASVAIIRSIAEGYGWAVVVKEKSDEVGD